MANGKFIVSSSQNEIVSSISFYTSLNNVLPQAWQQLGISLSEKCDNLCSPLSLRLVTKSGTSKYSFISIIQKLNAENIQFSTIQDDEYDKIEKVTFVLGPYRYVTTFINWKAKQDSTGYLTEKNLGLTSIEVTENY